MIALPLLVLALVGIALYIPAVQRVLKGQAVGYLEKKIGTPVGLERINLRFPLGLALHGVHVQDQSGDTLLYVGALKARMSLRSLVSGGLSIGTIQLSDATIRLKQNADSVFNFQYIVDAFVTADSSVAPADSSAASMPISVAGLELRNIRFGMDMAPGDLHLDLALRTLDLDMDAMDLDAMRFLLDELSVEGLHIAMRSAPSAPTPDTYPLLENPMSGMDIGLGKLDLRDIRFNMVTFGRADSLSLVLHEAQTKVKAIDLAQQRLHIGALNVDGLDLLMLSDTVGSAPAPPSGEPAWLGQHDGFRYWVRDRRIQVDAVDLNAIHVAMHRARIATPSGPFDPDHLLLDLPTVQAAGIFLGNDSIHLDLADLRADLGPHRFGLKAALEATPANISLRSATLKIDDRAVDLYANARIGSLDALYHTPLQVPVVADLHSRLDPDHWAALFRSLDLPWPADLRLQETFDTRFHFAGTGERIDSLGGRINGTAGTVLAIRAKGKVPEAGSAALFSFDVDQLTVGSGAATLVRAFAPQGLTLPQRLTAGMHVTGSGMHMQGRLAISSDLGGINGTLQAHGQDLKAPNGFATDLRFAAIDLPRILGDTMIGVFSGTLNARVDHLNNLHQRSGHLELTPEQLVFNGHDISTLQLRADILRDSVHARLHSTHQHLNVDLLAALSIPDTNRISGIINTRIHALHLHDLGLMGHPLDLTGPLAITLDLQRPANSMHLGVEGSGLRISDKSRSYTFQPLTARAYSTTDSSGASVNSNALALRMATNLSGDSLMSGIKKRMASYFDPERSFHPATGKWLRLDLGIPDPSWVAGLVVPELHTLELDTLITRFDSDRELLTTRMDLPKVRYGNIRLNASSLDLRSQDKDLRIDFRVARAAMDSNYIDQLRFAVRNAEDTLHGALSTGNEDNPHYRIPLALTAANGLGYFHITQGLVLNDRPWQVKPTNALWFEGERPYVRDMSMHSGSERISITGTHEQINLRFDPLQVESLLGIVRRADTTALATGAINGHIDLPVGQGPLGADLSIAELSLLGADVGLLALQVKNPQPDRFVADLTLTNGTNRADVGAHIRTSENPEVQGQIDIAFDDLAYWAPLMKGYIERPSGSLRGDLMFGYANGKPEAEGQLHLADVGLVIPGIGGPFLFRDEKVKLDDNGIHLDSFTLLDSLGNSFVLDGDLLTGGTAMGLDLRVRTDRFELASSNRGENAYYYGQLFTGVDLHLTGNFSNPVLRGGLSVLPGTDVHVVLPGSKVELVDHSDVVIFGTVGDTALAEVQRSDAEVLQDSLRSQLPAIDMDLTIRVDPEAAFSVVLDPLTGDAASFRGTADLRFRYDKLGNMLLNGPYTVRDGGYTVNFYGLVKKRFDLVEGSSVTWNGDPLAATMKIQARYISESAPFPLVANANPTMSEDLRNRLQARLPFQVLIRVGGAMTKPDIDLGLDLDRDLRNSYPQVNTELERLARADQENERHKQVFGLLVLNSFIQDAPGGSSGGGSSSSLASSAARNSLNGILTDQMNRLTGQFVQGVDIQLGVNTYDQSAGGNTYQRTSLDYRVSKRFANDRLSFEVGGSVGVNEQGNNVSNVSSTRAAQYAILYDLTPDGRFRLRGFHENAYDIYDGEITDSGIAFLFTREFEENENSRRRSRQAAQDLQNRQRRLKDEERSRQRQERSEEP